MENFEDFQEIGNAVSKSQFRDFDERNYEGLINYDNDDYEENNFETLETDKISTFSLTDLAQFNTYSPIYVLNKEESLIFHSCKNVLLKELIFLNRRKNMQLGKLYMQLKELLAECRADQQEIEKKLSMLISFKKVSHRFYRFGIPYFKTPDDFTCPPNPDTIKKNQNRELLYYGMTPLVKWHAKDINRLLKGVLFYYEKYIESESGTEKNPSTSTSKSGNSTLSIYPALGDDEQIDWQRVSIHFLGGKLTETDCKVFWNIYLHPDVNKSNWTIEETQKLKILAKKYNYQNWDLIASELGTNRSSYIVCNHYYSKVTKKGGRFTKEEDERLYRLVQEHKIGNYICWGGVAQHFKKRTRAQLFYRYTYFLGCKKDTLKTKFTASEDVLLLILVDRLGKKFSKCAQYFPNRSALQLKARYTRNLRGGIKKGSFSLEEDIIIMKHVESKGLKSWEELKPILNRSGGQIRQRYFIIKRFLAQNPKLGLEQAPRKKYHVDPWDDDYNLIRSIANEFKSYPEIPTLEEVEKVVPKKCWAKKNYDAISQINAGEAKKAIVPIFSNPNISDNISTMPNMAIDDLIVDYFSESLNLKLQQDLTANYARKAADDVTGILSILQAELYIPKDYELNEKLDKIDTKILEIFVEDKPITIDDEYVSKRGSMLIKEFVPPNLYTMVGMRTLLIKNHQYKSNCAEKERSQAEFSRENMEKQILWGINKYVASKPEQEKKQLDTERNLFYRRFLSLFQLPAIMSLIRPSINLRGFLENQLGQAKQLRTYGRRKRENINDNDKFEKTLNVSGQYKKTRSEEILKDEFTFAIKRDAPKYVYGSKKKINAKLEPLTGATSHIEDVQLLNNMLKDEQIAKDETFDDLSIY